MIEGQPAGSKVLTDLEPVTLGGAMQMVTALVQLIEAKALAQRLAFKALVQELSAAAGPELAFRIQERLDAMRWDPAISKDDHTGLRQSIAQELSILIEEIDGLVSGAWTRGVGGHLTSPPPNG